MSRKYRTIYYREQVSTDALYKQLTLARLLARDTNHVTYSNNHRREFYLCNHVHYEFLFTPDPTSAELTIWYKFKYFSYKPLLIYDVYYR